MFLASPWWKRSSDYQAVWCSETMSASSFNAFCGRTALLDASDVGHEILEMVDSRLNVRATSWPR